MLSTAICVAILCLLAVSSISPVQGKPAIIAPLPTNIYAIQFGRAEVGCTVKDTVNKPTKINFVRTSKFGDIDVIYDEGIGGRIQYKNKTEDGGQILTSTLVINNVTLKDSSDFGGYECIGYSGNQKDAYGFTINVINRNELPGIAVSENKTVQFGTEIILSCNLTLKMDVDTTKLRKLMWIKGGQVIDEVLYPKEQTLKSRKFKVSDPSDGGLYSCHLISRLRDSLDYNITDSIHITVKPKFFKDLMDNEVKVFKGKSATFECSAKGNPLNTFWKRKLKSEKSANMLKEGENWNSRYSLSNLDKMEDHSLTISDVGYGDRGFYYCCIQESETANNTKEQDDVEGCQKFTLRVKDPLGALWPVIGIIIEVILLVIIIVLAEKFKKKKTE
ncbi:roundabout homolog 1 isoform X2 [Exaiptasia diaphana]|nr:roundabout homolog 1 isoform X2 [Exaiptasia diaphana]